MAILQNHHVLAVHDLERATAFFRDVLGFVVVGQPQGWRFLSRDQCTVMLGACPDALHPGELGDHASFGYFVVEDADALHAQWRRRGGEAIGDIADKPWGRREFTVRSPEGHRFTVGQPLRAAPRTPVDVEAFARSWLGAFNAHDLDAIMAHYAEGIEHSSPTVVRVLGEPSGIVRGKPALRAYFDKALATAPPDLHYALRSTHAGVDGVTLVYHRTGGKIVAETFHFDADGLVARAFVAHAEPAR